MFKNKAAMLKKHMKNPVSVTEQELLKKFHQKTESEQFLMHYWVKRGWVIEM